MKPMVASRIGEKQWSVERPPIPSPVGTGPRACPIRQIAQPAVIPANAGTRKHNASHPVTFFLFQPQEEFISGTTEHTPSKPGLGKAFLDLAEHGETRWTKYVVALLIVLAVWHLGIIAITLGFYVFDSAAPRPDGTNPFRNFIFVNSLFIAILIGLWIGIRNMHKRPFRTLITPRDHIRWGRVFQGFGLVMGLSIVNVAIEELLFPGTHTYSLDPERFYKSALLVLLLTPFQTTTEELMMRSYLLQILGHFTRHPIALIMLNALPFALLHLMNPEIATYGIAPLLAGYFFIGAFFALVTLKDNGAELAIGMHAAINMFAGIFVNYTDSALSTSTVFFIENYNVYFSLIFFFVAAPIMYWILFRNHKPESIVETQSS